MEKVPIRIFSPPPEMTLLGEIRDYESLSFTRRFYAAGEFELHINIAKHHTAALVKNNLLVLGKNGAKTGIIRHRENQQQEDSARDDTLIVKGPTLQGLAHDHIIIDKEIWAAAQIVRKRHSSGRPSPCAENPFKGLLFCGVCGKRVNQHSYAGIGRKLKTVFRCVSAKGNTGMKVDGMVYTHPHKATYTKNPTPELIEYREKYGKTFMPRPMLCSDIRIPIDRPQKAFVQAWNLIVSRKARYQATLQRTADTTEDALVGYRAKEMCRLLDEVGKITAFDYPLMLMTLDRVETTPDEKLTFLFQSGIRITV